MAAQTTGWRGGRRAAAFHKMAAATTRQSCRTKPQTAREKRSPCPATYIVLRNRDGKATQHDGFALFLIVNVVPVVVLSIVAIGMVAIFRLVTVPALPLPLRSQRPELTAAASISLGPHRRAGTPAPHATLLPGFAPHGPGQNAERQPPLSPPPEQAPGAPFLAPGSPGPRRHRTGTPGRDEPATLAPSHSLTAPAAKAALRHGAQGSPRGWPLTSGLS